MNSIAQMILMSTFILLWIGGSRGQGSETTDRTALLAMKARWTSHDSSGFESWQTPLLPCTNGW